MSVRERVFEAAERLAGSKPFDRISFAEVAEAAGVHWTAVRRHFGGKEEMREWFRERQSQSALTEELADTKSRVLEAAARLFATQGYANSSLDKVAEHAGLSKGAVYWHFSGKQDLFLEILERNYRLQLQTLPGEAERVLSAEDPAAALAGWLEAQLLCLESGEEGSMLFLEFATSAREPEVQDRLRRLHEHLMNRVAELIREMQRRGRLTDEVDPEGTAMMFDALLKGALVEWVIIPDSDRLRAFVRAVSRTLWHGLAAADRK